MTRITQNVAGGDVGLIAQYNNLRKEAEGSSRLLAYAQDPADLTLEVSEGVVYFGNQKLEFAGGTSGNFTAPAVNPRIDILSLDSAGNLNITTGAENVSPVAPTAPAGDILICEVFNRVGQTSVKDEDDTTNGYIYKDVRPLMSSLSNLYKNFTASEDITTGMLLGSSGFKNDYVGRARRIDTIASHGISSPVNDGQPRFFCPIGGKKFVHLNYNTASSDSLFVQVGEINDSNVLSLGTVVTVATAITPVAGGKNMTVAKLDTDKFIVLYVKDSSTTQLFYRIGTVSGTTITLGTEAVLTTAGSTIATSEAIEADFIDIDKVAIVYKCATASNSRVLVATASGTVATAGTPVSLGATINTNQVSIIKKIATNKFVIACVITDSAYAQVGTISGSTITLGSEQQILATTSVIEQGVFSLNSHTTDGFVLCCRRGAGEANLLACTVSGTTITAGTPQILGTHSSATCRIFPITPTFILVSNMTNTANQRQMKGYTLSGTVFTAIGGSGFLNKTSQFRMSGQVLLDSGDWLGLLVDATNVSAWVYGMSNNFIGVAQNTAPKGSPVTVLISGVDENQSNLITGNYYQVTDAGLVAIGDDETVNSLFDVCVVVSISPTEIKF
jgi:hypothetical protein